MKVFVCLFAIVACAQAGAILHAPAVLSTGTSSSSRTQDAAGNYAFAYNEQHATGGSSRQEQGAPGVASGSYTLNVADGRARRVDYVADALGFRAAIATNEPGTAAQPAASTAIASPNLPPQPVAPLPVPVAHAPVAPVLAHAPVAHAPLLHADVAHGPLLHAPVLAHAHVVPAISSYSTAINHGVVSAPLVAHDHVAAPVLAHAHAPLLAHHAAPLVHPW